MTESTRRDQLIEAFDQGLPALTIEIGRLYLETSPEDEWALNVVGQALRDVARYVEAEVFLMRALAACSTDRRRRVLIELGRLKELMSDYGEAERFFREAIAAGPDDTPAYIFLGAMLAGRGQLEAAELLHRQATECVHGDIDEAYLNLGYVLRGQGRYFDALESFRHSLELDPLDLAAQDAARDMEAVLFRFPAAE